MISAWFDFDFYESKICCIQLHATEHVFTEKKDLDIFNFNRKRYQKWSKFSLAFYLEIISYVSEWIFWFFLYELTSLIKKKVKNPFFLLEVSLQLRKVIYFNRKRVPSKQLVFYRQNTRFSTTSCCSKSLDTTTYLVEAKSKVSFDWSRWIFHSCWNVCGLTNLIKYCLLLLSDLSLFLSNAHSPRLQYKQQN